ncbi:hypothetical protein TMEN_4477 [Trichophyton mentagrophytes]|nr:hypothetical protein TMEN_4477 [Trichophyton mentagrophytes]
MEIQPGEDRDILSALDTLSSASSDTLMRLRKQVTKTIGQVNQKLAQKHPSTDGLLDIILKSHKKIHGCFEKSEEELTQRQWTQEDPRITDIRKVSGRPTNEEKYRSYLGERSLALEKEAWELKTYGISRVNAFVGNLAATSDEKGNGVIQEFIRFKGFSSESFIREGIMRGQKCLVNERLYPLRCGSSAIYSLRPDSFRRVPYPSLPALNDLLGNKKYQSICQLIQAKSDFLRRCQALYDDRNNAIIGLLNAGPQYGLSATKMSFIGMGGDGTNIRVEEIHEQSAGAQLLLTGANGADSTTAEESGPFRRRAASEAFANEEVTRPRQDGTSRRTGSKRRRPNDTQNEQSSTPNQHGSRHRPQEVHSQTEGAVTRYIYFNAAHHEAGTDIPGTQEIIEDFPGRLPSIGTLVNTTPSADGVSPAPNRAHQAYGSSQFPSARRATNRVARPASTNARAEPIFPTRSDTPQAVPCANQHVIYTADQTVHYPNTAQYPSGNWDQNYDIFFSGNWDQNYVIPQPSMLPGFNGVQGFGNWDQNYDTDLQSYPA